MKQLTFYFAMELKELLQISHVVYQLRNGNQVYKWSKYPMWVVAIRLPKFFSPDLCVIKHKAFGPIFDGNLAWRVARKNQIKIDKIVSQMIH